MIERITSAKVSPWSEHSCKGSRFYSPSVSFFQCLSDKGEYGFIITAHINPEVQPILQHVLTSKKALVVINSCIIKPTTRDVCLRIVRAKNPQSELYFARQELSDSSGLVNYVDNVGTFGFGTTVSERELFQQRRIGLEKAIRTVYDKVVLK